ncbi:TetR/AcrR family transcriptional regulator [Butyrivibrio sp. NC3005]|uniref:TetR/AcrR family transcriptional regulator n=1 Tax=Butyrivibrio sp. NC3005 TaxID=1280685 RepID=UPI000402171A|nr:TetR/AcrR family transcriptional regulator [Butyrivibrio sp. NC3005]
MNEKFFDLKKERQNRIINASLQVFAKYGYEHASTDEIVKVAEVSKGLLFHYFINKKGLYLFLIDYSYRFMELEIKSEVHENESDFFALQLGILKGETSIMRKYPYMKLFMEQILEEKDIEDEMLTQTIEKYKTLYRNMLENVVYSGIKDGVNLMKVADMISYTGMGVMKKLIIEDCLDPDNYARQMGGYLIMISKLIRE